MPSTSKRHPNCMHYLDNYYLYKVFGENIDIESAYAKLNRKLELLDVGDRDALVKYPVPSEIIREWKNIQ